MPAQLSPVLQSYLNANRTSNGEFDDVELELVDGELPAGLRGTLYRNGNGRFENYGVRYEHLFDGDGMISRFTFDGRTVRYRNRFVRTNEFLEEERAGRMLYRSFGTNLPGGLRRNFLKMRFKNAANTSVIRHGGHFLALWEGGLPHRIDSRTLETLGRFTYDGVLLNPFSNIDRRITPELPFSAHPKIHPDTGILYNFGTAAGTRHRLVLYEVSPEGQARISQAIPLEEVTFAHDFVLTQGGRQIFFLTPVYFDLMRAMSGQTAPAASIRAEKSKPTEIIVVEPDGEVRRLQTDFGFIFHFANGYEADEHTLIVDGLMLDDYPNPAAIRDFLSGRVPDDHGRGKLVRYRLDLANRQVTYERLTPFEGELPEINPNRMGRPYRYVWAIGRPPNAESLLLGGIIKIDTETGEGRHYREPDTLASEPAVVPRPGSTAEDDAWLLFLRYHAPSSTTHLIVADAATLETQARLRLPHNIPLGFHGLWEEAG